MLETFTTFSIKYEYILVLR